MVSVQIGCWKGGAQQSCWLCRKFAGFAELRTNCGGDALELQYVGARRQCVDVGLLAAEGAADTQEHLQQDAHAVKNLSGNGIQM